MKKEVATRNNQMTAEMEKEFQDDFHIDSADILIPKILLMQPASEMVGEEKASIGDFMNSVTEKKIANISEPFEFVPFYHTKIWDIVDPENQREWIRSDEFLPGQDNLPWDFEEDGKARVRIKRLNFFGFIPKEVETGGILPYILSFKSTGYREGTKILTQWKVNMSKKVVPFADSFFISGDKLKNEKNQIYCVPKVNIGNAVSEDLAALCMTWYKDIKHSKVKVVVDDSDLKSEKEAVEVKTDIDTSRF